MLPAIVAVLAAIVGLHLLITFSLISRVRTLQDMLTGNTPMLKPGTPIAAFEAATPQGETLSDALLRDRTVLVGFFAPGCGPCDKQRGDLLASPPELPVLAFVGGQAADPAAQSLLTSLGQVARVAYTTANDAVYRAFQPVGYPSLYRVENGQIAAIGHRWSDVIP
jgi:thiol-disulfide isomerase/thioredoxin